MKAGLDYFGSRQYAYFLTIFSANNADSRNNVTSEIYIQYETLVVLQLFLSAFAGIYYLFWLTGCEFIHKSPLEKYTGHIFTINVRQLVYFCIFLKAFCCFVRI